MSLVSSSGAAAVAKANPIARWGNYESWRVTGDEIHLFDKVSMSREWVEKSTTGSGKKKKTVKAHQAPIEFKFTFSLYKEFFQSIDIAQKIRDWNSRVGKTAPFYLGSTAFGANAQYQLVSVSISDVKQVRGIIVSCTIELEFKMASVAAKAKKKKKRAKKKIKKKSSKKKKKLKKK